MGLLSDAKTIARRDPAAKGAVQVFFLYPGFHAVVNHRIAHFLHKHKWCFLARLCSQCSKFMTGIEIHPGATLGSGLFIDHGSGVVIGETAVIGDNCTLYHGVTLGGTGKEKGVRRHPVIENDVLIGAGAKILGAIQIGANSLIGANAVVLNDVPPGSTVVGVPARVVRVQGSRIKHAEALDHGSVSDPIEQEICVLQHRIHWLEEQIRTLIEEKEDHLNDGGPTSDMINKATENQSQETWRP